MPKEPSNGAEPLCPPSPPAVTYPCLSGLGTLAGCSPAGPSPVTSTPSKPPPPSCSALLFQLVGRLTSNSMLGAAAETGTMTPRTAQYSPFGLSGASAARLAPRRPTQPDGGWRNEGAGELGAS